MLDKKRIYSYNKSGNDAFGNCTIASGTTDQALAKANPIRYRGYYYDTDTGLYYLNARYYNPQWRRFISPDSTDYLDPETPNGLNLYAYCNNDPVNYKDPSGRLTIDIVLDCFFAANSLIDLIFNPSLENLGRAALDLACLVIPVVTGMGTAITKFDDIKDIASFISKNDEVIVLGQSMNTRIIPLATTIGASFYGGLDDYLLFEKRYGSAIASLMGYSDNMIYIMMNSLSGAKFIDYGFDTSRTLSKAIDEGKLFGEIMSRFTIYSERIFARLFRRKNILRILERFRN